jgi:hypothetical protein
MTKQVENPFSGNYNITLGASGDNGGNKKASLKNNIFS